MPGQFSITSRTTGETLTAAKYNADRQDIVDHLEPAYVDDYSASVAQMRTQTDPGESGSESQPTTVAGEIERLRYRVAEIAGQTYWYQTGSGIRAQSLATASLPTGNTPGRLARVSDGVKGLWMDNGTIWTPIRGVVNVAEGATAGAGSLASPWTGWETFAASAANTTYYFQPGVYSSASTLNFAHSNITVIAEGVLFKHTGTGVAFASDVGSGGAAIYGFTQHGKLTIQGNANTTDGVFLRGSHHICLDRIRVQDCTGKGLLTNWVVGLSVRQFTVSSNEGKPWTSGSGFTTQPQYGVYLDTRGVGEYTSIAHFESIIIEGVSVAGIHLETCRDCLFSTGTSEGNPRGVYIAATAYRNTFNSVDFESNTNEDASIDGLDTVFVGCNFQSASVNKTIEIPSGKRTKFYGGYIRTVNLQSTSADTMFFGSIFSDNGALGIVGSGTYRAYSIFEVDSTYTTTSRPADHLAEIGTFTPVLSGTTGAGTFTYSTQTGTYSRIGQHVQGVIVITLSAMSVAPTGTMRITGLPYNCDGTVGSTPVVVSTWGNVTLSSASYTMIGGRVNSGGSSISLTNSGSGVGALGLPASGIGATSSFELYFSYTAAQN